jgi:hypothetical protein
VTAAQRSALLLAEAADEPIKVPAGTARALHGRGLLEPFADGWAITDHGRALLDHQRSRERFAEVRRALTTEAVAWADRVTYWLLAHDRLRVPHQYAAPVVYAAHVAAADFDGVEPAAPQEKWADGAVEWVCREVRMAVQCLKDYDKQAEVAKRRGVSLEIAYSADPVVPRPRATAAKAAAQEDGAIDIRTYRERRPKRPSGGTA